MTNEEAIKILRDTPIDIRSTKDDILTLYTTAQNMAIDALSSGRYENAMQKLREMPRYLNGVKANQIKKIPPEDVQVIRCKDCKYWQDNNGGYPNPDCRWNEQETPDADDFCSFGERREP